MDHLTGEIEEYGGTLGGELASVLPSLSGDIQLDGTQSLVGELNPLNGVLEGALTQELPSLSGQLALDEGLVLTGDLVIQSATEVDVPPYDGSYEIAPVANAEVILSTTGKKMLDDVTVLEIPYYETSNESGGYTVIIG